MKKVLVGFLALVSLSSFADCIEIALKKGDELRGANAAEVEVINFEVISSLMRKSSRVVCGNSEYGSYLYVDTGKTRNSYKIRYQRECETIVEALNRNPDKVYKVETGDKFVTSISKDKICEGSSRIILDL